MIQKRNGGGGVRLAPWNVSSNQNNNYKTNIPINATMIGTIGTALSLAFGIWMVNVFKNDDVIGVTYCILVAISTFQMPIVLAFTIKHHRKTSRIDPVVPQTLQFHEEDEETHVNGHQSEVALHTNIPMNIVEENTTNQLPNQLCHI